jgi:hypothetical protein
MSLHKKLLEIVHGICCGMDLCHFSMKSNLQFENSHTAVWH